MKLVDIAPSIKILGGQPGANDSEISQLIAAYKTVPEEYIELVREATKIELQHENGKYLRIWGPYGCMEMDDSYNISKRIKGALPIGDDGGGRALVYLMEKEKCALYVVGFGDLDREDCILIAPSLSDVLMRNIGVEAI